MTFETDDSQDLEVSPPKDTAAGIPSITATMDFAWRESGIARGAKALIDLNQKGGIDCNSCAWADPDDHRTIAEFCESGAKAVADEATQELVTREFFSRHSVEELARKPEMWLNSQGRIAEPFYLAAGATHYKPIEWSDAFRLLAEELNSLDSPDEAVFYTSGRTSNEAAFLYQLFVRMFGTNNLPDCSNMCHESTSAALTESIGLGKATIRLEDLEDTDLIIIMGQNPGTCAPRMMSSLEEAKRKGASIISVNPLPEAGLLNFINPNPQHYKNPLGYPLAMLGGKGTHLTDLFLQIRIGGDMAVLKGMMKALVEMEQRNPGTILDQDFIRESTEGFEAMLENLGAVEWEVITEQSGITREQITEAAEMFARAGRVVTCWAMGVTQHKHSVATVQDIANLHFMRGQIGRQGAGLCPVRGHSNVQGDRTMGIWEKMKPDFRAALEKEFHFKTPEKDGFDTVKALHAMHDGHAKVFFAVGGNFLRATPDTKFTEKAFKNCRLTAQVLTKLNRSCFVTGKTALILPCLGRTEKDFTGGREQFVSTESTMLNLQMSRGVLEPASPDLRSEVDIVGSLAKAVLGENSGVEWQAMANDYDLIRNSISRVVSGCENYSEKIRRPGGFYLPNPPGERKFDTKTGKAVFTPSPLNRIELKDGELLLATIRAHDQFNTTVYKPNDRYRGIKGSRTIIFMNAADIAERGLESGQLVDITSHFEGEERCAERFTIVEYPIPRRCAAAYFPEANVLVPVNSTADKSNCPTSKLVIVTVSPV
jgi:molybdopterin-dependent oxidoreductase alpha subunit